MTIDTGLSYRHRQALSDYLWTVGARDWSPTRSLLSTSLERLTGLAVYWLNLHVKAGKIPAVTEETLADVDEIAAKMFIRWSWAPEAVAAVEGEDWWQRLVALAAIPDPPAPPIIPWTPPSPPIDYRSPRGE